VHIVESGQFVAWLCVKQIIL